MLDCSAFDATCGLVDFGGRVNDLHALDLTIIICTARSLLLVVLSEILTQMTAFWIQCTAPSVHKPQLVWRVETWFGNAA